MTATARPAAAPLDPAPPRPRGRRIPRRVPTVERLQSPRRAVPTRAVRAGARAILDDVRTRGDGGGRRGQAHGSAARRPTAGSSSSGRSCAPPRDRLAADDRRALDQAIAQRPRGSPRPSARRRPRTDDRRRASRSSAAGCRSTASAATSRAARRRYPSSLVMTVVPARVAGVERDRRRVAGRPRRRRRSDPARRRRRSSTSTRCSSPAAPRRSARSPSGCRTAPRSSPVDRIVGPGQRLGDGRQARGRRRSSGSTCRPARRRAWSSPTTTPTRSSSPPTSSPRPSTAPTRRRSS